MRLDTREPSEHATAGVERGGGVGRLERLIGRPPVEWSVDGVTLVQWVLRNLAQRRGWRCSFDPILRQGHAGSGMHFHFAPVRDGRYLAVGSSHGPLPEPASWLVVGLASTADALMAFGNRASNSFVRLVQAKEAPSAITWGRYNRKALVRLPAVATDAEGRAVTPETVEFRLPDGSAHPHLLLAGIVQAMIAARRADVPAVLAQAATDAGSNASPVPLPRTFQDVAAALRRHRTALEADGVFPPHVIERTADLLDRQ